MSNRVKTESCSLIDYEQRLKEYFSFHLDGLEVNCDGGEIQVQIVYCDFKHLDIVRRELKEMFPEVEFLKIKRNYTFAAECWIYAQMMNCPWDYPEPTLYVENEEGHLVMTDLSEIARKALRPLNLIDDDKIPYDANDLKGRSDEDLRANVHI